MEALSVSVLLPILPILTNCVEDLFRGCVQPLGFLFLQVAENGAARSLGPEMNVRGLPSHGAEQALFLALGLQGRDLDAAAMRAEAADDPVSAELHEGIDAAHGTTEDGLIQNFRWTATVLRPIASGRHHGFGLACDFGAVPIGDRNVTLAAQAAHTGHSMRDAVV